MNITEIRVKLVGSNEDRLKAFCSVTIDGAFVIRDLKVIEGANGPFVAMPSRKLSDRCGKCGSKNHLRAKFCNECGNKLDPNRAPRDAEGRIKLHADVAHPINAAGREQIQREVIDAYEIETEAAEQPGYEPKHVDFDDLGEHSEFDDFLSEIRESVAQKTAKRESTPSAPVPPSPARERSGRDHQAGPNRREPVREVVSAGETRSREAERKPNPPPVVNDDPFSAGIL